LSYSPTHSKEHFLDEACKLPSVLSLAGFPPILPTFLITITRYGPPYLFVLV